MLLVAVAEAACSLEHLLGAGAVAANADPVEQATPHLVPGADAAVLGRLHVQAIGGPAIRDETEPAVKRPRKRSA